jgi:ATP-dependent RNA helicase RhlE
MTFEHLLNSHALIKALGKKGYEQPTPIQQQAIPHVLAEKDLFGCAQTGTGKTAAFALPILQLLETRQNSTNQRNIQALILAPTRELALQISDSFRDYGVYTNLKHTVIFGGVSQHAQTQALKKGVDILIATPGRLLDLMNQGFIKLNHISMFVLDEADRMLDMGFIHDIKRITAKLPQKRQTLFFSATVSPEIRKLANTMLNNPVSVAVTPVSSTAESVEQAVYLVKKENKRSLLKFVFTENEIEHVLVFTRTKHGADKVVKFLNSNGIKAEAIHGNKSQNARERALNGFKNRTIRALVATDIASRGIDVDKLSHVINFDMPEVAETYVHRIGRTGRKGESGIALSFCDSEEMPYLKSINKLINKQIPVVKTHPFS